jgi:membrane protein implicated in regulation of membrane protease activity
MTTTSDSVRRAVLTLVGLVLLVDALFIGGYFLLGVGRATSGVKLSYTIVWTAVILLVVLHSLARVRAERIRRRR